jgi:hypothetical protein
MSSQTWANAFVFARESCNLSRQEAQEYADNFEANQS